MPSLAPPQLSEVCPICGGALQAAAESYSLGEIFQRWQEEGHVFSPQALAHYPAETRVTLFSCAGCGFGIFEPPVVGTDEFYQELSGRGRSGYYSRDTWEHRQAFADLAGCRRVLEIGCGAGFFLERLREQGKQVQGLELNGAAAAFARSRGLDVEQTPLEAFAAGHEGRFDAVCLFQVLEHVAAPLPFLGHALACLQPRGLLLVSVPNMAGVLGRVAPLVANLPPHQVSRWTDATLRRLALLWFLKIETLKYEPVYNFLGTYWQERLGRWGVPAWLRANKLSRKLLALPVKVMRTLRPQGLAALPGHTVYVALRRLTGDN